MDIVAYIRSSVSGKEKQRDRRKQETGIPHTNISEETRLRQYGEEMENDEEKHCALDSSPRDEEEKAQKDFANSEEGEPLIAGKSQHPLKARRNPANPEDRADDFIDAEEEEDVDEAEREEPPCAGKCLHGRVVYVVD